MDITNAPEQIKLCWAVMMNRHDGKSEVVKIVTDHSEADLAVQTNPGLFYKSGPVQLVQ